MPKRDAANELNHDNWEDEEEPEEAGEFKKASEDALKGRKMMKAKRRNLTEDQKKNIFAGFGGFTSSNKSAEEAFSFLGKPKTDEKKEEEAAPAAETNEDKKTDGEEEKKNGTSKPDDLMAKFMTKKSGSWTCEVCMITNDADRMTCIACESPRPGGGGGAPATSFKPPVAQPAAAEPDPLMAKFMKKSTDSSKWTCEVCMITNDADRTTCIACESPRPGSAPAASTGEAAKPAEFSFGGGGGFKFVGAETNKSDSSFGGFKFGATTSTTEPAATSSKTEGGFKFGSSTETPAPSGGFKFGNSDASPVDTAAPQTGGFKFAASESSTPSGATEPSAGFKFGNSPEASDSSSKASGFQFSTSDALPSKSDQLAGFKFGVNSAVTPASTPSKNTSSSADLPTSGAGSSLFKGPTGFLFSATEKVSGTPKKADSPAKAKRKEYLASLKALNTQVTNWIKSHVDENPLVDLSPVFKDYGKHLEQLRIKYDMKSIEAMGDTSQGTTEEKATNGDQKSSPEDETEHKKDGEETKAPFSFGVSQSGFGNLSSGFGSGTGFSFGFMNKKSDTSQDSETDNAEVVKDEGEEQDEGAKEESKQEAVVEEGAFYSKKCKLFYKKEGAKSYTERGLGNIHLKLTEEKKVQVVVRAGTSLGNILLNVLITEGTHIEKQGKNNIMVICVPNPPIDPKAEPQPTPFLIRVKTSEEADELKEKLLAVGGSETETKV